MSSQIKNNYAETVFVSITQQIKYNYALQLQQLADIKAKAYIFDITYNIS